MNAVVRAWLGFFALGAGLIHLALVIGSPLPVGIPLVLIGIAEFAWGVFAFTAASVPFPRAARIAAVVPILGWVLLLVVLGPESVPGVRVLPMLAASVLDLAVAITITAILRRTGREPRPLRSGPYLIGLGVGALAVAALTTPALAATEAGDFAQPHGTQVEEPYVLNLPDAHQGH
ncbi:MAG: hypothetical protein ABI566_02775 [Pseudolysinimonas sp.]